MFFGIGDDDADFGTSFAWSTWIDDSHGRKVLFPEEPMSRWLEDAVNLGDCFSEIDRVQPANSLSGEPVELVSVVNIIFDDVEIAHKENFVMLCIQSRVDLLMPVCGFHLIGATPRHSWDYAAHARQLSRSEMNSSRHR